MRISYVSALFLRAVFALFIIAVVSLSCHKKKPTAPPPQAFAVSLQYRNYFGDVYCLRLKVGTDAVNRCGLGTQTSSIWAGDYECQLYAISNPGPGESLTLLATSPLHLDRNFTCIVDGPNFYWQYWGKKTEQTPWHVVSQANAP